MTHLQTTSEETNAAHVHLRLPVFSRLTSSVAHFLGLPRETFLSTYQKECIQALNQLNTLLTQFQAPPLNLEYLPFNRPTWLNQTTERFLHFMPFSDLKDFLAFKATDFKSESQNTVFIAERMKYRISQASPLFKIPESWQDFPDLKFIQTVDIDQPRTTRLLEIFNLAAQSFPHSDTCPDAKVASIFTILSNEWAHAWSRCQLDWPQQQISSFLEQNGFQRFAKDLRIAADNDEDPLYPLHQGILCLFADSAALWLSAHQNPEYAHSLTLTREMQNQYSVKPPQSTSTSLIDSSPFLIHLSVSEPSLTSLNTLDQFLQHFQSQLPAVTRLLMDHIPADYWTPEEQTSWTAFQATLPDLHYPLLESHLLPDSPFKGPITLGALKSSMAYRSFKP